MIKKIILTGIFIGYTFSAAAQFNHKHVSLRDTITDNSIVYPEDMERNYDELLSGWKTNVKYADNCQINSNESITFHDSVYIHRLYSLPTKMELVFNPIVRNYIEMYAGRRRSQVSYMLGEGKHYFPIFEEALDKEGLPLELKYLPVIESALNPIARSRVGATGLWQFMAPTGKQYSLEVNSLVDERRDPHKSTSAAVKYLKDLYSVYGDWNLVIAAYNCGPGNVNKAIRRSGGRSDYWAIYPYLPKETRGYVPAFIAATYIMNYHNEHNICPAQTQDVVTMDSLIIDKNVHFQQIADIINMPIDELRQYNPQFKDDIIPGDYKEYALNLPINKLSAFIDNESNIYSHRVSELFTHRKVVDVDNGESVSSSYKSSVSTHRVKKGESLGAIAKRYGVSSKEIQSWNKLSSNRLSAGRVLKIYRNDVPQRSESRYAEVTDNSRKSKTSKKKNNAQPSITYYKVRKGDTWNDIARKNGVSVTDIRKWNNIKTKNIIAGTRLKIVKSDLVSVEEYDDSETQIVAENAASAQEQPSSANLRDLKTIKHKVKLGETINQIAHRYNVSKEDIINWNNLSPDGVRAGQQLQIYLQETSFCIVDDNRLSIKRTFT